MHGVTMHTEAKLRRWISHPERYPFRCPWSHQEDPADGPYLDAGLTYFEARLAEGGRIEPDRRESVLYISPQALIEASQLPGSPIVVMPRAEWQAMSDSAAEDRDERARLEDDLADANAALLDYERRLAEAHDHNALADAVAQRLDERYARKSGRKPGTAA